MCLSPHYFIFSSAKDQSASRMGSVRLFLAVFALSHPAFSGPLDTQDCECVEFWLCNDQGKVVTDGSGVISHRVKETCSGLQVCCLADSILPFPDETTTIGSEVPPPDKDNGLKAPSVSSGGGCGRVRFPADLGTDFKVTGLNGPPETTFYGEAPWMVVILEKKLNFKCGGTLITPSVVLTAAHCIMNVPIADLTVRAGAYENSIVKNTQTVAASRVSIHPKFNEGNLHNDIALIFLERNMKINAVVDFICTPEDGVEVVPSACVVTGWGRNATDGKFQAKLSKVNLVLRDRDYCIKSLRSSRLGTRFIFHNGFICAGGEDNRDTCRGDGGGPLICPAKNDPTKLVQMGVVSWGIGCGEGYPTVLTSTKYYLPWIKSQIK